MSVCLILECLVYDPRFDQTPVDQVGFVDLVACKENNSIPANVNVGETEYNGVEDAGSLLERPDDQFARMRQVKKVVSSRSAAAEAAATTGNGDNE